MKQFYAPVYFHYHLPCRIIEVGGEERKCFTCDDKFLAEPTHQYLLKVGTFVLVDDIITDVVVSEPVAETDVKRPNRPRKWERSR